MEKKLICRGCKQEIGVATSCGRQPVVGFNQRWERVPFGHEIDFTTEMEKCPKCLILVGAYHHTFCEFEECPRCQSKIDDCGCFYTREK